MHASDDVATGNWTIVYATDEPEIAVPPVVRVTATEYGAPPPGTAVNEKVVELIVAAAGVVNVAVDVSV